MAKLVKLVNMRRILSILLGLFLLSSFLISIPELVEASTPSNPPIHIHLTWEQDNVAHTIVISWRTEEVSTESEVLYDTVPRGGDPALYEYSTTGVHQDSVAGGTVHDVELTDLLPDTRYYFICGGTTDGYSSEKSFRTISDNPTSFKFVMGGDSRSQPAKREEINKAMAKFDPLFVIFTGDMVSDGDSQDQWDNWFKGLEEQWVTSEGLTIPCIPVRGNHEITGDWDGERESPPYFEQFCLPGNERWYSLSFGENLLHVVNLDLTWENQAGPVRQVEWLENDLATHASYKWTIVSLHVPAFNSGTSHESIMPVRETYCPVFDKYHVDLVVCGHEHIYERTGPINYTLSDNSLQPSAENGTIYIVSGGWGAPMYTFKPQWWTVNAFTDIYHFILGTVIDENLLILEVKDNEGVTLDSTILIEGNLYGIDEGIVESMVSAQDSSLRESNRLVEMQRKEIENKRSELSALKRDQKKLKNQVEELLDEKSRLESDIRLYTILLILGVIIAFGVGVALVKVRK